MTAVLDRPIVETPAKSDLAIGLENLADLLERGAKMKPQARGLYFAPALDGTHTCAIGAMIDAMAEGQGAFTTWYSAMPFEYCEVDPYMRVIHPTDDREWMLESATVNLNDKCGWSREQIAAWYRQLATEIG